MKHIIILLIALFPLILISQKNNKFREEEQFFKLGCDYYENAFNLKYYEFNDSNKLILSKNELLSKALTQFEHIVNYYPKSAYYYKSLYNKGYIELSLDSNKAAKNTFIILLNSKAKDKSKGGLGSGIMAEPYTNYKNRAAKIIAEIYIEEKNYEKAIEYLNLTKKYPYYHYCGNEYEQESIYLRTQYAICYNGLNMVDSAISILLPKLLESGLSDNSNLIKLLYETLLTKYSKLELIDEYEKAFNNYIIESNTRVVNKKKYDVKEYYIYFLNKKLQIWATWIDESDGQKVKEAIMEIYKGSKFYTILHNR